MRTFVIKTVLCFKHAFTENDKKKCLKFGKSLNSNENVFRNVSVTLFIIIKKVLVFLSISVILPLVLLSFSLKPLLFCSCLLLLPRKHVYTLNVNTSASVFVCVCVCVLSHYKQPCISF